jgi:hypothetical protein
MLRKVFVGFIFIIVAGAHSSLCHADDESTKFGFDSDRRNQQPQEAQPAVQVAPQATLAPFMHPNNPLIFSDDELSKRDQSLTGRSALTVDKSAPAPFIDLFSKYIKGDREGAQAGAVKFVQYMKDLMFAVKDISQMIGEAMVQKGQLKEEEWVGVEQLMDYQSAQGRKESGSLNKVTHEDALARITPDKNNEAEIYYFMTLSCSWCRQMAPDVERLWRIAGNDNKLKMVALTLGPTPEDWLKSYREYTGLTIPILNGDKVAKQFRVGFVPAVVVVAPDSNTAYTRTGKIEFKQLFEFVRKVQGKPLEFSQFEEKLLKTKIGKVEKGEVEQNLNFASKKELPNRDNTNKQPSQAKPTSFKEEIKKKLRGEQNQLTP